MVATVKLGHDEAQVNVDLFKRPVEQARVKVTATATEPSLQPYQDYPPLHKGGVMLSLDGFPTAVGSLAEEEVALITRYVCITPFE